MTPSTTKAAPHSGLSSEQLHAQSAVTRSESLIVDQFVKDGQTMIGALTRHATVRRMAAEVNLPRRPLTEADFVAPHDPTGNFGFTPTPQRDK